jgi:hypothetical protein
MSRFVADHLTQPLLSRLSIESALNNADRAILICTVDEHGWPHPAMLSSLEVVARDARNIRLGPHHQSRTARNLRSNGRLTIVLADERGVFYIKGDVLLATPSMTADPNLAGFNMRVDSVLEDVPHDYESAKVVSGIAVERGEWNRSHAEAVLRELTA